MQTNFVFIKNYLPNTARNLENLKNNYNCWKVLQKTYIIGKNLLTVLGNMFY